MATHYYTLLHSNALQHTSTHDRVMSVLHCSLQGAQIAIIQNIHRKSSLYLPLSSVNLVLKLMGTPDGISSFNTLLHTSINCYTLPHTNKLRHTTELCRRCIARCGGLRPHCNTLQHITLLVAGAKIATPQHTATPQHIATPQHTATNLLHTVHTATH